MIIKVAPPHANVGKLVMHLGRTDDGNEEIRFLGARGVVVGDDLRQALSEMKAISRGSNCQKPLYHVAFNAAPGENLSPADWERCLDRWERAMRLEDRQRAVVQHHKDGRWHTHAVWNRVDPETGRAVSVGRDHFTAKRVAREIEKELGLQLVGDQRPPRRQAQQPPLEWEAEQARRTKTDTHTARDQIRTAWEQSDSGRGFQHALEAQGLILAQGEKRPFLVVDGAGNFYAVNGRVLPGERMTSIREKLSDLDLASLPEIDQARARQLGRDATAPASIATTKGQGERVGESGLPPPVAAPAEASPADLAKQLHEQHRQAHLEFNRQAKEIEARLSAQFNKLAEAHTREQQLLAEKQRERWWNRVMRKSEKQRQAEAQQRLLMDGQQARERAALEAKAKADLVAIDQQRAALRALEKSQKDQKTAVINPTRPFDRLAKPISEPARSRTPEQRVAQEQQVQELKAKRARAREREQGRELGE